MGNHNAEYWREYRRKNKEQLRLKAKIRRIKNPEPYRQRRAQWVLANPEKVQESQRRYYLKRKLKETQRVRMITGNAIKSGELIRQPCQYCNDLKVEAHHNDYSKPLEVQWLCPKHHKAWHRVFGVSEYNGSSETRAFKQTEDKKKP